MKRYIKFFFFLLCFTAIMCLITACDFNSGKEESQIKTDTVELCLNKTHCVLLPSESVVLIPELKNETLTGEYIWQSLDNDVATVDNGKVTAISYGVTYISVNYGTLNAQCKVSVISDSSLATELEVILSESKIVLNACYDNARTRTITAKAYKNGEEIESDISWVSSDEEFVSVNGGHISAITNGGIADVIASVSIDGIKVSGVCKVVTEDEVVLNLFDPEKILEPQETYLLSVDVNVNGEPYTDAILWKTSDCSVATVEDGEITAISGGTAIISATVGNITKSVSVSVYSRKYIYNAEQFLSIGEGDNTNIYILANDIDFGAYLSENIWLNRACLIETFSGILDGKGYSLTGLKRFFNEDERACSGIFGTIKSTALIKNLYIQAEINSSLSASVFSESMSGTIENCYLDLTFNGRGSSNGVFSVAIGNVRNSIIKLNTESDLVPFNIYGVLSAENCLLVANDIGYGAYLNGIGSDANPYITDTYYYKSVENLIDGNGYAFTGEGKGTEDNLSRYGEFGASIWDFDLSDKKVSLKNETDSSPIVAPYITDIESKIITLGESYTIVGESSAGIEFFVRIFNESGRCVKTSSENLTFTSDSVGKYIVVASVKNNSGVMAYSVATIIVKQKERFSVQKGNFLLTVADSDSIVVADRSADEFNYYSLNEKIAVVDENGTITAKFKGITQINVVEKATGLFVPVVVEVINQTKINYIFTQEDLLNLNGCESGYYVLAADINLEWTKSNVVEVETSIRTDKYAAFIETFGGVLDGNGHKIAISYENTDISYIHSGLFYKLDGNATIKNLNYEITAEYVSSATSQFTGLFAYRNLGVIEDCYIKANVKYKSSKTQPKDQEGFIAVADNLLQKASINNCIFVLEIKNENGEYLDCGYAVRVGTRGPHASDCVFIRNGKTPTFYGQMSNGGSTCELKNCYFYRTIYDFVNAENGYLQYSSRYVVPISDNGIIYSGWSAKWRIGDDGIYLLGKKVADVSYVDYSETKVIDIKVVGDTITWSESGTFIVYVNNEYIGTCTDGKFDVYRKIFDKYGYVGNDYNVIVENIETGLSGIVVLKIKTLTQANFIDAISASTASDYFILAEDVRLDETAYAGAIAENYCLYAFDFNGTLDGRGHKISVEYNATASGLAGLFHNVNGTMRNFEYEINAGYNHSGATYKGFFAYDTMQSVIENAYIHAKVKKVSGTPATDSNVGLLGRTQNNTNGTGTGVFKRCIFDIKFYDSSSATYVDGMVYCGPLATYVKFNDCVFINGGAEGAQFGQGASSSTIFCSIIQNSYKYATMEKFLVGANGYACAGTFRQQNPETHTYTETAIAGTSVQYDAWNADGIWAIDGASIRLCGKIIYTDTRVLTVIINKESLTITDNEPMDSNKTYVVYAGRIEIGTFTGTRYNVGAMLENSGLISEGENIITITVKTARGRFAEATAVFKATVLAQANFMTAIDASTVNDYFILAEDVNLTQGDYLSCTTRKTIDGHIYAVSFSGTLDGRGHKISVRFDNVNNYFAGLFYTVNGTMKNFEYEFNSDYMIQSMKYGKGFFAFNTQQSIIENAYIHVKVRGLKNGQPAEEIGKVGILAYPNNGNAQTGQGVGVFKRCIFDIKYYDVISESYINGKVYCGGGATYVAFDDCVFINGGEAGDQFVVGGGTHAMYSAKITDSYKYATMIDYLKGQNGYLCSGNFMPQNAGGHTYTETAIAGTSVQYVAWNADGIWTIDGSSIRLYGRTVFSDARAISADIDKEILTITDSESTDALKEYAVYVGTTEIGTFTGAHCDVGAMLENSGFVSAGVNNITIIIKTTKGGFAETTAVFKATILTQANFIDLISASTASDYFILAEDVRLDETAYTNAITENYCLYAFDFNGTLDGRGHKISVEYNDTASGLAGLFHNVNGTMKNFEYEINAGYRHTGATYKGFFAFDTVQSVIENAYIHAKVRKVAGTAAADTTVGLLGRTQNSTNGTGTGVFKRCIFEMKYYDTSSSTYVDAPVYCGNLSTYVKFNDCVFINGGAEGEQFGANAGTNSIFCSVTTSSYKYATVGDFLAGKNGYACAGIFRPQDSETHTYEETAIAGASVQYDDWNADGVWNISETSIRLCGRIVYENNQGEFYIEFGNGNASKWFNYDGGF